ncbi:MAG: mechanosensitive ion channel, partial [Planctomycetales bacterium]|nr:mechanosensitive ion channel [Planctomycetales bacterium]
MIKVMEECRLTGRVRISLIAMLIGIASSGYGQAPSNSTQSSRSQLPNDSTTGVPQVAEVSAGDLPGNEASTEITSSQIEAQQKALSQNVDVSEVDRVKIADAYRAAMQSLDSSATATGNATKFDKNMATLDSDTKAAVAKRDAMSSDLPKIEVPPASVPLAELEQQLSLARQTLEQVEQAYQNLQAEPNRRTDRLAKIPGLIKSAEDEVADLQPEVAAESSDAAAVSVESAQTLKNLAKLQELNATIKALKAERVYLENSDALIRARTDIAARDYDVAKAEFEQWQQLVNQRRQESSTQQQTEAAEDLRDAPEVIQELARENRDLAAQRAELAAKIEEATTRLQHVRDEENRITAEYESTRGKVEAVGLSQASGQLLREERGRLPNVRQHRANMIERQPLMGQVRFDIYELNETRNKLASIDIQAEKIAAEFPPPQREQVKEQARAQLAKKRDYVDALIADKKSYSRTLLDLDEHEETLIEVTESYRDFIDGRVLWIRSEDPLSGRDAQLTKDAVMWLLKPGNWTSVWTTIWQDVQRRPMYVVVMAGALAMLVYAQPVLRKRISELGEMASRRAFSEFSPTVRVLLATITISLPVPLVMWYVGWRISASLVAADFANAFANALFSTGIVLFLADFSRQVCRPLGLADVHFEWPIEATNLVRRHLRWLMAIGLPATFVFVMFRSQTTQSLWDASLGRIGLIIALIAGAAFLWRVLKPGAPLFQHFVGYDHKRWLYRLRYAWYPIAFLSPVLLMLLALVGYYNTSQTLSRRLFQTVCLVSFLVLSGAILNRWVLMVRRRLAIQRARQRLMTNKDEATSDEAAGIASQEIEAAVDLASVSDQTKKLISIALVVLTIICLRWIWADVLPAFSILQTVRVWPGTTEVTLAQALLAVLALVGTYIVARNAPGLLELTVLKHLPLDAGSRYAINMLTGYAVTIAGISLAGQVVGFTWDTVQWLVAAMGIGLGFGLQEIFGNFVSGIILLFERPLRVGDIVTLGDTTGVVTRIRMRATTITDWDRKEYVVPNKDLITGTLLNWTLTDQTNRLVIPVGIAYGSDTKLALELLLKAADDHPLVLSDPAPNATFE